VKMMSHSVHLAGSTTRAQVFHSTAWKASPVEIQFEIVRRAIPSVKNAEKMRRARNSAGSNTKIALWKTCESCVNRAA